MKQKALFILLVLSLLSCSSDNLKNPFDQTLGGVVKLKVNLGNFFIGGSGNDSPWNHVYQESLDLTFFSTTSLYSQTIAFNPNDISTFPDVELPYDTYTWSIENTGIDVTVSSVLYIYGNSSSNVIIDSPSTSIPLGLETDFALVTISTENLNSVGIRYNDTNTGLTIQDGYYFGYINTNNSNYTLNIVDALDQAGYDTITNPEAYSHYNYQLTQSINSSISVSLDLIQNFALVDRNIVSEGDDDMDGVLNSSDQCPDTPIGTVVNQYGCDIENAAFLDENEITVKAFDWAQPGDTAQINGVTYTVVDEVTLRSLAESGADVSNVVTSKIQDMSYLFQNKDTFNQDISSWDVSGVTIMSFIFSGASSFNQDISFWDVSNVNQMTDMFWGAQSFNQDISNWDVSDVRVMNGMFYGALSFNQDVSSWDVSMVSNMNAMFFIAENFNQDLSNWNVSNVIYCGSFSSNALQWTLPKPNFTNCIE